MNAVVATSGGHTFPVRRIDDSDPLEPTGDSISWSLELDGTGEVEVARAGCDGSGPWGVDLYRPGSGRVLTVGEARRWAHALLAAADLAEQLEHVDQEVPC